jgi:hypothetical protein
LIASVHGGQHMRVEVTNIHPMFGVELDVVDQSKWHYEDRFFGNVKVRSGDKHSIPSLLTGRTRTFDFYRHRYTPMLWQFSIGTNKSAVASMKVKIFSEWRPGDYSENPNYKP